MDADGSDILRLTSDVGRETDPQWSPDGRRIVYSAGAYPGNSALFIIDADGSNRRQLTSPPLERWSYSDFGPAWSPDGRWIVFDRHYDCDPFQDNNGPSCVPGELRITSSSPGGFASVFLAHGRSANWGE
jgi:Tol biopolymer transport system component